MEWQDLLTDGYQRVLDELRHVLKGLDREDVLWQPHPGSNSIGWLAWHLTRVQDGHISELLGEEQLWIKEGWHTKFNRPPDAEDTGFGDKPEEVAAFDTPDVKTLIDYHKAVLERSKGFFRTLTAAELDRELDEPWFKPLPTVGVRLVSVMADGIEHAGQAGYVRGLRQGMGWQKY
jgi:uncharacterized damage-inducible protein DinB